MHLFGGMEGHWLGMALWLVLVVAIVALIMRAWRKTELGGSSDGSSLEILRKRFARGLISRSEFEKAQQTLLQSYISKEEVS